MQYFICKPNMFLQLLHIVFWGIFIWMYLDMYSTQSKALVRVGLYQVHSAS